MTIFYNIMLSFGKKMDLGTHSDDKTKNSSTAAYDAFLSDQLEPVV